jgi:hypothetical protein
MKTLWICCLSVVAVFTLSLFVMPAMQERHAAEAKAAEDRSRDCTRAIHYRNEADILSLKAHGHALRGYEAQAADARVSEACK